MPPPYKICTHNGTFHLDEVTAYTILNYIIPENILVRTRDQKIIDDCDFVVDVGKVYDPDNRRYDHHQGEFNQSFCENTDVPLSSAGLVYLHHGREFIRKFCQKHNYDLSKLDLDQVFNNLYFAFFVEIDAFDNGYRQYSDNFYDLCENKKIKQNYPTNLSLGQVVAKQNNLDNADHTEQLKRFKLASDLVLTNMEIIFHNYFQQQFALLTDSETINNAMAERFNYCETGEILVVDIDCPNWRKCIYRYEKSHPDMVTIKFIIYTNSNNEWNIRAMSDQLFKNRVDLKPSDQIKELIPHPEEIVFVHTKLFIGGAKTLHTDINMGRVSLGLGSDTWTNHD